MKRLTAILLLVILVFNFYGYRLVISYMQKETIAAVEAKVDKKEYNDNELISIKTTLNLPYYTSTVEYERAYGSIHIDGKDYEYVKRRVYNDTLELLCIPNHEKTKLETLTNDLARSSADGSASAPDKKNNTILKVSLPDFFQAIKTCAASFVSGTAQKYFSRNTQFLPVNFTGRLERPPKSMHPVIS